MNLYTVQTDKRAILKKLKEIGLDQQEDRESPDKEMDRVIAQKETSEGSNVEYYNTLYTKMNPSDDNKTNKLLADAERVKGADTLPSKNQSDVSYGETE